MNVQQLVAKYESGAITGHELVVDCLTMLDPGDPSGSLGNLPPDTLPRLREFLDSYRPGEMMSVYGGAIPTPDQVLAARRWLTLA
jgi:hypothetical protein